MLVLWSNGLGDCTSDMNVTGSCRRDLELVTGSTIVSWYEASLLESVLLVNCRDSKNLYCCQRVYVHASECSACMCAKPKVDSVDTSCSVNHRIIGCKYFWKK